MERGVHVADGVAMKCSSIKAHHHLLLLALGCLSLATSCSTPRRHLQVIPASNVDDVSYWDGDHMTGSPSVRINLAEQRAYLFKGDQLAGVSLISSGREGLGTVTGSFRIIQKDRDHKSSVFGDYVDASGVVIQKDVDTTKDPMPKGAHYDGAKMPNFMRIVAGTGMHEGFLPGYAASHGCIRMPGFMAEAFFQTVSVGTPVKIE